MNTDVTGINGRSFARNRRRRCWNASIGIWPTLSNVEVKRRVLAFYFHPWEFWPMPQDFISFGEGAVRPNPLS